jgi:hypothetical protein
MLQSTKIELAVSVWGTNAKSDFFFGFRVVEHACYKLPSPGVRVKFKLLFAFASVDDLT